MFQSVKENNKVHLMYLKVKTKRYLIKKLPRGLKARSKVRPKSFEVKCSKQMTVDVFSGSDHQIMCGQSTYGIRNSKNCSVGAFGQNNKKEERYYSAVIQ